MFAFSSLVVVAAALTEKERLVDMDVPRPQFTGTREPGDSHMWNAMNGFLKARKGFTWVPCEEATLEELHDMEMKINALREPSYQAHYEPGLWSSRRCSDRDLAVLTAF